MKAGPVHPGWSPRDSALLSTCVETRRDGRVGDETWAALASSLRREQLIDIVFTIGQYGLIATALNSLGSSSMPASSRPHGTIPPEAGLDGPRVQQASAGKLESPPGPTGVGAVRVA